MKHRLTRLLSGLLLSVILCGSVTAPASAASFSDVPAGHWAEKEISRCVELGFFKGQTATFFGLGQKMSRSAFAVVLQRFFGWESFGLGLPLYQDIPADAWYADAVETAYLHGALTDQSDEFRPGDAVTREEVAVMLIRALEYGTVAGLAQTLESPFTDVTTNAGYITMAYDLGVVNGTTADTFSPDRAATREQVAVMLIRLYDKLHTAAPKQTGFVSAGEEVGLLPPTDAVMLPAAQFSGNTVIATAHDAEKTREAIQQAGKAVLLEVTGTAIALKQNPEELSAAVAEASAGYDGVLLNIPRLKAADADALTELAGCLRTALADKLLYVAAEAPAWQGTVYDGYDFEALAALADRILVRIAPYSEVSGGIAVAPAEPLEEVYYTLRTLKRAVPGEKLSLQLTTTGTRWSGGWKTGMITGTDAAALAENGGYTPHYSDRYACAYLVGKTNPENSVWYPDGAAAAARAQLARFFGVGQVCLSDLAGTSADFLAGLA